MLGSRIRHVRVQQQKTIEEVAQQTSLSKSLISQIETGKVTPSVNSLLAIAKCLTVPIGKLFDSVEENSPVVRERERRLIETKPGVKFYLLVPHLLGQLEVFWNVYHPGATSGRQHSHEGEECGIVLKGKIEVQLGRERHRLRNGDSIYFSSSIPHTVKNTGKGEALTIWINTPPTF